MTDEPTSPENLPADGSAGSGPGETTDSPTHDDPTHDDATQDDGAASTGESAAETIDEEAFWQDYARLSDPYGSVGEGGNTFGGETTSPPPPPFDAQAPNQASPPSPAPRLVRDPYSRLGGVSSGIAHYYGFDVSLIRLAFVLTTIFSGSGLLAYLVAWIVIPRADFWPPVPRGQTETSSSSRKLGTGLLIAGAVFAFIFGGSAGSFLIPILLIGGGVWLLLQEPRPAVSPAMAGAQFTEPDPYNTVPPGYAETAPWSYGSPGQPGLLDDRVAYGAPVPPPSKRRGVGFAVAIIAGVVALIAIVVMLFLGLVFAAFNSGSISFDGGPETVEAPLSIDELPSNIDVDGGELLIDLTALDASDFDETPGLDNLKADVGFGSLTVIVPEGIEVAVDADAGAGDVSVFGETDSGFGNSIRVQNPDADLKLDLDLGLGDLEVIRG